MGKIMIGKTVGSLGYLLGYKSDREDKIKGFAFDSREVLPGFVFFALPGKKVDGHEFVQEALAKGAVCAIVSKPGYGEKTYMVDDVLKTLHFLAKQQIQDCSPFIIGITGSVGKTTTKEMIAALLQKKYKVAKTPGNANSQVGFPLSVLQWESVPEVFVAEMGMTQIGEIKKLVAIAPPDIAVVTGVSLAHVEFFPGGLSQIAEAKAEILSHEKTKIAILSEKTKEFAPFQKQGSYKKIFYKKEEIKQAPPFAEDHLAENLQGAIVVAKEMGLSFEEIHGAISQISLPSRRFERVEKKGVLFVNDSYNAQPASVKAALMNLPTPQAGRRVVAVLSEMRELGAYSEEVHKQIGEFAAGYIDTLVCEGVGGKWMEESFRASGKVAIYFSNIKELKESVHHHISPGDVVLLKGSKPAELWTVLESY